MRSVFSLRVSHKCPECTICPVMNFEQTRFYLQLVLLQQYLLRNKQLKKMQHWQKVLDLQLCKNNTLSFPPHSQRQLPAFPRLPDGARYPELSPTLALRTTGQTKTNKQKSHTSGQQFFQFSGRQTSWDYTEGEGQGEHKSSPSSF